MVYSVTETTLTWGSIFIAVFIILFIFSTISLVKACIPKYDDYENKEPEGTELETLSGGGWGRAAYNSLYDFTDKKPYKIAFSIFGIVSSLVGIYSSVKIGGFIP